MLRSALAVALAATLIQPVYARYVTASQLLREFAANGYAARSRYDKVIVHVRGRIGTISQEDDGRPFVVFTPGREGRYLAASMSLGDTTEVRALRAGQEVAFNCNGARDLGHGIIGLHRCSVGSIEDWVRFKQP